MDKEKEIRLTIKRFRSDLFFRKTYIKVHLPEDKELVVHSELAFEPLLGLFKSILDGEMVVDEEYFGDGEHVKECRVIIR